VKALSEHIAVVINARTNKNTVQRKTIVIFILFELFRVNVLCKIKITKTNIAKTSESPIKRIFYTSFLQLLHMLFYLDFLLKSINSKGINTKN
jgi:hypothetical protein